MSLQNRYFNILVISIVMVIMVFFTRSRKQNTEIWFTSISQDGRNKISVFLIEDTDFFASQKIDVYAYANDRFIFSDKIRNDGKNLKDENCFVNWSEDSVTITFSGEEQADIFYKIHFIGNETPYSKIEG